MKPKNFPGRKNERRMSALARLESRLFDARMRGKDVTRIQAEIEILTGRIMRPEQARAIRTKKVRPGRRITQ